MTALEQNSMNRSKNISQGQRISAIDICRGLAVIFMVLVHVHYVYSDQNTLENSVFGTLLWALGLGAPVFLFAMGLSFTFSRKQSLFSAIRRGLIVLAFGYLVNFICFVLPLWLGLLPKELITSYQWQLIPGSYATEIKIIATGDILHLAGLCLIAMGFARSLIKSPYGLLALSVSCAILTGVIQGYRPGIPVLDGFCDLLWGTEWNVFFPFFPWSASVFLGMAFGLRIQQSAGNTDDSFQRMLPLGLVLSAIGGTLWWYNPELHYRDFFHMGPGTTIALMGVTALLYWFTYRTRQKISGSLFERFTIHCSHRVTSIYLIHIVLLTWMVGLFGFKQHQGLFVLLFSCAILSASLAIDFLWLKILLAINNEVKTRQKVPITQGDLSRT